MILSTHLALHALETSAHNVGGGSSRAVSAANTLVFEASSVHDARVRLHLQTNKAQEYRCRNMRQMKYEKAY